MNQEFTDFEFTPFFFFLFSLLKIHLHIQICHFSFKTKLFGIIYTIHKQHKINRCIKNDLNDIKTEDIAIDFYSKIQVNQQAYWSHRSLEQHFLHEAIGVIDNLVHSNYFTCLFLKLAEG